MDLPPTRAQLPGADELRRRALEDVERRMSVCQIVDPGIPLPCPHRESGGRRCEVVEPHQAPDGCGFSLHTAHHERAGNGYACSAIDPPLKPVDRQPLGWIVIEHPKTDRPEIDHAVLHPSVEQAHFWAEVRTREARRGERYTVHAVDSIPEEKP